MPKVKSKSSDQQPPPPDTTDNNTGGAASSNSDKGTGDDSADQTGTPPPPGIPEGLPPDMWVGYLIELKKVEANKEIELARLAVDKEVALKKIQNPAPLSATDSADKVRVPNLRDQDDIDVYLRSYEMLAGTNGWDKSKWAHHLIPALSGKAREAYANLSLHDSQNYDTLKAAILAKYEINAETFRLKFRNSERKKNQSITEWANELRHNLHRWVEYSGVCINEGEKAFQDLILIEQLLSKLPRDLAVYLRDKALSDSAALAREADTYVLNRGGSEYWKQKSHDTTNAKYRAAKNSNAHSQPRTGEIVCFKCNKQGHLSRNCPQQQHAPAQPPQVQGNKTLTCFACGQVGHVKSACPNSSSGRPQGGPNAKKVYKCDLSKLPQPTSQPGYDEVEARMEMCKMDGKVQGQCVRIARDSCCTQSAIRADLVPPECYLDGQTATVKGISGEVELPLAKVNIECCVLTGPVVIGVVDELDCDVILGHDLDPTCSEVMKRSICVLTRAQAQKEFNDFVQGELELRDHMDGSDIDLAQGEEVHGQGAQTERPKLTGTVDNAVVQGKLPGALVVQNEKFLCSGTGKLSTLQRDDSTLAGVRDRTVGSDDLGDHRVCFFWRDGILMRKWTPSVSDRGKSVTRRCQKFEQIVVPKDYRSKILEMAHDLAGHMGVQKTKDRVLEHFYWPGVFQDVQRYCRTCDVCQRMDKGKRKHKAPLIPMPVIDVPFKRVGMDIVGPFVKSKKRNLYLLTIVDYATRFPEAIPLTNVKANTVVDALISVFARVGLPQEIVHDQGTNFMSKVMTSLCEKLRITQLKASVRHQETNGLTERFHGTLKNMLRLLSTTERQQWDEHIPLFLFAYREVPCETTGYSPFELLYGRPVRGPLGVLKETWMSPHTELETDMVNNLLDMRKRINALIHNANANTVLSQQKMKGHYDQQAVERVFDPGDKVLVFLPEGSGKLDHKWQGPYVVKAKLDQVNYEIQLPDKRKSTRVFHINLIKKYFDREDQKRISTCYYVTGVIHDIGSVEDNEIGVSDDDINQDNSFDDVRPSYVQTQTWQDVLIPDTLSQAQVNDLTKILEAHSAVFSDVPGRTHLVEHEIRTNSDTPIRQRAYRTPHALKDKVREEIENMLRLGIIEPTTSAYASPIVVVAKPGGDIRVTTDFRGLNKVCDSDPYSMPRTDEILDDVASAKFISTLDLTKGFYQVPLSPESQAKSAFVCSEGQFCYKVLPFGLQNSSSTFQRLMDKVLSGCEGYARAYIDDICIKSNTWQEHLIHITEVLTRLKQANLTVKPVKCTFGQQEVCYLGHIIGNGKISPKLDKVQAINEWPIPITKKHVRAFLGLSGYYRKFIPNFSEIAHPLTALTKKSMPNTVVWSEACNEAFVALKKCLANEPVLRAPDFDRKFILQTDASQFGIGAVLSQVDDYGDEHPTLYLSRKMLSREQNYSVAEKECLAIVWAIGKLQYYLFGHRFIVVTDHKSLQWLEKFKASNNRLMRWFLALQPFEYDVVYRKGSANGNADALSRI